MKTSQKVKLGDIAKIKGGKRLPKGFDVQDNITSHPYVRVTDMDENGLILSNIKYISDEVFSRIKNYTISSKDIYISIAGTIGRVGIVPDNFSGSNLTENAAKITKLNKNYNKKFITYFLQSNYGQGLIKNRIGGTSQPKLPLYRIAEIIIPNLIKEKQDSIVDLIEKYNDLIDINRQRIKLLEEAARLLFREWFEHFRFPGHEKVKIVDGVPEGWKVAKVKDLGQIVTGKTPSKKDIRNFNGNVPFIKTPDMHKSWIISKTEETLSETGASSQNNKYLPPWSVLVSCIGTVGIVAMNLFRSQTNQQINSVIPKKEIYRYYSFFCLSRMRLLLEAIGGGSTMTNVNKNKFENLSVNIPPDAILKSFDQLVDPAFRQVAFLLQQNQKLTQARDLLLPRLMSGEIEV